MRTTRQALTPLDTPALPSTVGACTRSLAGGANMRSAILVFGMVLAAGCSSTKANKTTTASTGAKTEATVPGTDQMATGKLSSISNKELTLQPYAGGMTQQFKMGKEVPVFFGDETQSTGSLSPGADVRVFYRGDEVVALEVLSGDDIQKAHEETEPAAPRDEFDLGAPPSEAPPAAPDVPENPEDQLYNQ